MKRLTALVCLLLASSLFLLPAPTTSSQNSNLNSYGGCPMKGQTNTGCLQALNRLKNRWKQEPASDEINSAITLEAILASGDDENRWSTDDGAEITGYVSSVTGTGPESCNCYKTTQKYQDIHIDVVTNPDVLDGANPECKKFVVEITPRWKKLKGWTLSAIKNQLEGKWVKFRGWMFFDRFHIKESLNTRNSNSFRCRGFAGPFTCGGPSTSDVWRATAWEIHPVTSFEVVPTP